MLTSLRKDVQQCADPEKAKFLAGFFKTGKGQYGEGDVFYGITVPQSRKIAVKYNDLPFEDVTKLLQSKVHEERLIALLILVSKFSNSAKASLDKQKGDENIRKEVYDFYLAHTKYINNWDLVDLSADKIVGEYIWANSLENILVKLAKSKNLWEKRISIIATYAFIKNGDGKLTLKVADILLKDQHDLIQKAVGWMLREVGKRVSEKAEEEFLKTRYQTMPRIALRYAIERFPEEKRKKYLNGSM